MASFCKLYTRRTRRHRRAKGYSPSSPFNPDDIEEILKDPLAEPTSRPKIHIAEGFKPVYIILAIAAALLTTLIAVRINESHKHTRTHATSMKEVSGTDRNMMHYANSRLFPYSGFPSSTSRHESVNECILKCDGDATCLGFFTHEDSRSAALTSRVTCHFYNRNSAHLLRGEFAPSHAEFTGDTTDLVVGPTENSDWTSVENHVYIKHGTHVTPFKGSIAAPRVA